MSSLTPLGDYHYQWRADAQHQGMGSQLVPPQPQPRWFTTDDWTEHRQLISRKYTRDHMSLKAIRSYMRANHQLLATLKMYKDRFKAWGISKKLQFEEVVALLRIKAARDAAGTSVEFSRWGEAITMEKLQRYQRDNPNVLAQARSLGCDEAAVGDLIQNFLPSRGLVALCPHPFKGLGSEQTVQLVEVTLFPLQAFADVEVAWQFEHTPNSPWLLLEALSAQDPLRERQVDRTVAWRLIQHACHLMESDIIQTPNEFFLQLLWVMGLEIVTELLLDLGYQIMRHASELFKKLLGSNHPYTLVFAGAAKLTNNTCTYRQFQVKLSEVLIDSIVKRLNSEKCDVSYTHRFIEVYDAVSPLRQSQFVAALHKRLSDQMPELAELDRNEVLYTLAILREHPRNGTASGHLTTRSQGSREELSKLDEWRRVLVQNTGICLGTRSDDSQSKDPDYTCLSYVAQRGNHELCGLDGRSDASNIERLTESTTEVPGCFTSNSWRRTKTQWVAVKPGSGSMGAVTVIKMPGLVKIKNEEEETMAGREFLEPRYGLGPYYIEASHNHLLKFMSSAYTGGRMEVPVDSY